MTFKGYRTLITAIFPLVWAILAAFGVDVPLDDRPEIVAGATAVAMIFWRTKTDTPIGKDY